MTKNTFDNSGRNIWLTIYSTVIFISKGQAKEYYAFNFKQVAGLEKLAGLLEIWNKLELGHLGKYKVYLLYNFSEYTKTQLRVSVCTLQFAHVIKRTDQ